MGSAGAPRPLLIWGMAAAGCVAAVATLVRALTSDDRAYERGIEAALLDWIILSYIVSGLVAWWRRPESRFGPLMVAAGFVIGLTSSHWTDSGLPYTIGWALDFLPAAIFLHVYLAFPTGLLHEPGRTERSSSRAYVTALGLQIVAVLIGGFGPGNVLAIVREPGAAETLLQVQLGRPQRADAGRRRAARPAPACAAGARCAARSPCSSTPSRSPS